MNGSASSRYTASRYIDWRGSQRISSGLKGTRCASPKQPMAPTPKAAAPCRRAGRSAAPPRPAPRPATHRWPRSPGGRG
jgi:hypothetical protein